MKAHGMIHASANKSMNELSLDNEERALRDFYPTVVILHTVKKYHGNNPVIGNAALQLLLHRRCVMWTVKGSIRRQE